MGDKKSQLTFLVSINEASSEGNVPYRNSIGLEPVPYFCTKFNLQQAIVYLSQELHAIGLNCNFIDSTSQKLNLISLVNACWEVTQLYRSSVRDSTSLLDQRRRDASDISHFQNNVKDLRASVEEKERQVCDAQERERQALTVNKALSSKVKSEKEEIRRLNSVLQQREGHHQHELRKKEAENNRLRERLHRLVSGERSSEARPVGMTVSNTLSRSNRSRAMWKTEASGVKHEEEMHRRMLGHYEAWVGQLNDENDQLKGCLSTVTSQLSKIVNKFSKNENILSVDGEMNSSLYSSDSLENPLFNLEFPTVREQIHQTLEDHLKMIVQLIEEKSNNVQIEKDYSLLKKEVGDLQNELTRTKDRLDANTTSKEKGTNSEKDVHVKFADDGFYVEEFADLDKKKEQLEMERKSLQQERETFSAAAIRLNREKAAFEAEKVELLKRQFLRDLPPALSTSIDMTTSGHESACSMSSGSLGELFTDSPQKTIGIPAITPPRASINLTRMSTPVVLGPTRLPKQQRDMFLESSSKKSVYRLKSAPASRASSIPRQEETDCQTVSDKETSVRPYHSRPNTLERRRKPKAAVAALRYRSQSQSRLDTSKDGGLHGCRDYFLQSHNVGEAIQHSKKTDSHGMRYQTFTEDRESLGPFSNFYRDAILHQGVDSKCDSVKRLSVPQSAFESKYCQEDLCSHDGDEYIDPVNDTRDLKTLENDLFSLIAKIGRHHGETANISVDEPPPYEVVTRNIDKKATTAGLVSAPGSLASSRRSSQDFSGIDDTCKRTHKRLVRK